MEGTQMNDYKVTDSMGDVTVTAIDEKDARRNFRSFRKCGDSDILAVELIRENVPATKAQEKDALERIRAIVATLGPRSYVGTALDGCLTDAETNIENDFGDSTKARWESAEAKLKQEMAEHNITAQQIITWQNEMINYKDDNGKPYSPVYLKTVHNQLSAIFNHAVRYYNLRENPC